MSEVAAAVGESTQSAFDALGGYPAWAAIRLRDSDTVTLLGGSRSEVTSLLDVPLETGLPTPGRRFDRLLAIPFKQVAERGFQAHDDGTPLVVVDIESEVEVPLAEALAALPLAEVDFTDRGGFESDDAEYAEVVEAIIRDEIGQGEGANLVIGRNYRAVVADWDATKALTVFRRLLVRERGAYWTYLFFTGRPLPDRRQPGAARERARRRRADEPDLGDVPDPPRSRRSGRSRRFSTSWPTRRRSTNSSWWWMKSSR